MGDVVGDRAVEELNFLGQIADMFAQALRPVLVQRGARQAQLPWVGVLMPVRMRTSDVLPAPLRPMTPSASPGVRSKDTFCSNTLAPGCAT